MQSGKTVQSDINSYYQYYNHSYKPQTTHDTSANSLSALNYRSKSPSTHIHTVLIVAVAEVKLLFQF